MRLVADRNGCRRVTLAQRNDLISADEHCPVFSIYIQTERCHEEGYAVDCNGADLIGFAERNIAALMCHCVRFMSQ